MYILKIKGNGKIPDHIQIRDESFTLIAYFKSGNHASALKKCNLIDFEDEFLKMVSMIPYNEIIPLTFKKD